MIQLKNAVSKGRPTIRFAEPISTCNDVKYSDERISHPTSVSLQLLLQHPRLTTSSETSFTPIERKMTNQLDLKHYQRALFQNYLQPLSVSSLKSFHDRLPYDADAAISNWKRQTSNNLHDQLSSFKEQKPYFDSMMKYLIRITPPHLKNVQSKIYLEHLLATEQMNRRQRLRMDNFHEIPQLPNPLTKENFEEYIYNLTHTKHHYRNSSSLQSGIIPQILLNTHSITNNELKPFRSATTFNYLIKFFGCDKNQSLFARDLVLIMNEDGHHLNYQTIELMLKICVKHSRIRSNTNTFQLVLKYLRLAESLGIHVNLNTWTTIYDTIRNRRLKERFWQIVKEEKIPITKGLQMRVLDDYMDTTQVTDKVIKFLEHDLKIIDWRNDDLTRHKLIEHKSRYGQEPELSSRSINNSSINSSTRGLDDYVYALKFHFSGLKKNKTLKYRSKFMFEEYCKYLLKSSLDSNIAPPRLLKIYTMMIQSAIDDFTDVRNIPPLLFLIRGLIHDATMYLNLPKNSVSLSCDNVSKMIPENYKILARETRNRLLRLQATVEFLNSNLGKSLPLPLPLPWQEFTLEEQIKWQKLKMANTNLRWSQFVEDQTTFLPENEIKYVMNGIRARFNRSRDKQRLARLNASNESEFLKQKLLKRKLLEE